MTAPSQLAQDMAKLALETASSEPEAIRSLIVGATIILTNRFGSDAAAQMILDMAIEARVALNAAGMYAEPTRH